jgi:hypothetical protein
MDETYRMLGKERQADLEQEARKHHVAAAARAAHPTPAQLPAKLLRPKWIGVLASRLAAFFP